MSEIIRGFCDVFTDNLYMLGQAIAYFSVAVLVFLIVLVIIGCYFKIKDWL